MDFAQALVDKVGGIENLGKDLDDIKTSTPIEESEQDDDVYEDSAGRLRDPKTHKFVAREQEEQNDEEELEYVVDPEAQEAAEEAVGDGLEEEELEDDEYVLEIDDPALEAYLEKYDGDIGKALKAAANQTDLIGRQGSEVGQLRGELDQLKNLLIMQSMQAQQGPQRSIQDMIDDDPQAAAVEAIRRQDPEGIAQAIEAWREEDEWGAAMFVMSMTAQLQRLEYEEMLEARGNQAFSQGDLATEVGKVLKKHPDLENHLPAIAEAAKERPMLRAALEQGDPVTKANALADLYAIAMSRQIADTSSEALKRTNLKIQRETQEAKAKASVVSAGRRKAQTEEKTNRVGEFKGAFRQHLGLPDEDE